MNGTPRLRSAFPATPQTQRRSAQFTSPYARSSVPSIDALRSGFSSQSSEPLIPTHLIDAPTQRFYAAAIYVALLTWRIFDFNNLKESDEQSLWLFMKWIFIDGLFFFGLPSLRIPWLEWSPMTMMGLYGSHALLDAILMFRIPIPIMAGFAAMGRGVWGAYELAVNERSVNPQSIFHNESLILGRQIIHILPEGSAVLNADREAFCIDSIHIEARLPITINATNPISMELLRVDLETQANETLQISKSQIKSMHKEASRLISYSDKPNEPKTLYYSVKKPGLYVLQKVMDETNLEVARKRLAHTVVVPCPKAIIKPSGSDKCKGELSNVEMEVVGTPPLRVKYRKMINQVTQESTFERIQPEDFHSPLAKQEQNALVIPNRIDTDWARPQRVQVPLSEHLGTAGRWVFSIDEVKDGFGNIVSYTPRDQDDQERHMQKSPHLYQNISVHERPTVNLQGCNSQHPLKVARGRSVDLPVQYGSTGRGAISDTPYHLEYLFTPDEQLSPTGEHGNSPQRKRLTVKNVKQQPQIRDAGLYTLAGVSTDFCGGEVMEPASCLLQNPPEPDLAIATEEIFDKCAGSPIGLRVDLDLIGTPPFDIAYRMSKSGDRIHNTEFEQVKGHRGQIELTPKDAGHYRYEFIEISDAVYKAHSLQHKKLVIEQNVKPSASANFIRKDRGTFCIDQAVDFEIALQGEDPFSIEWELLHAGKREKFVLGNIQEKRIALSTPVLSDGGEYTIALATVTDRLGCKEFLKDEMKINVRHQKPRVGFGAIESQRSVTTVEGKKVQLPLRLAGELPWTVKYLDQNNQVHQLTANHQNDRIPVAAQGTFTLVGVQDAYCPGTVDEATNQFDISWISRPELRIAQSDILGRKGNNLVKDDVCEGEEDAVELLFKGSSPYHVQYAQHVKPLHGTMAPKNKDIRAAVNVASLRMDTAAAGAYEYRLERFADSNYEHSPVHFTPVTIQQRVHPRPSAAFTSAGKTYSYCSVESDGEEVIPITLSGTPPFELEIEIKHHGTAKPETVSLPSIQSTTYQLRIPHRTVHLGRSSIALRRVSDSRGCSRLLDSSTPKVQIAVYDAPTITPMENQADYCVGDRLNFGLSGVAPFSVFYTFEGAERKAVVQGTTFRRLAEKPGTFVVTGVQDSASSCRSNVSIEKRIHGLPSVRVSKGRESIVDIHEGSEADILFEFGGTPPFEFTYTRSSNAQKGGKSGAVLDMKNEVSDGYSLSVKASEEGTYEVVAIKDAYCAYAKPGVKLGAKGGQKKLTY